MMNSNDFNRLGTTGFCMVVCCLAFAMQLQAAEPTVPQHAPASDPSNAGGWVLNMAISDEFDSEKIDASKWHIQGLKEHYENNFKGRAPSQFVPDNVSASAGHLRISTK